MIQTTTTDVKEMKHSLPLLQQEESQRLFGAKDENLRILQNNFTSKIVARGTFITVIGPDSEVPKVVLLLEELLKLVRQGDNVHPRDVEYLLEAAKGNMEQPTTEDYAPVTMPLRGKKGMIKPKTYGQRKYLNAISQNDIVFGIGPAGTGKTYLAVAAAVSCLQRKDVKRIILTRPAVEAGESLGYLPGDLKAKVDPFLRPLYDALHDMLPSDLVHRYIEQEVVEIAPLAFMRGRTLNNSFVILDEAQNTTHSQMKMFLTRLGFDSKAIITGDVTQTDLPSGKKSGLVEVSRMLKNIDGIEFSYLSQHDVVRHPLVQKIITAYDVFESHQQQSLPTTNMPVGESWQKNTFQTEKT